MNRVLRPVLSYAHDLVSQVVRPGCLTVDATVGHGHDTLHLARTVGRDGKVLGFDIQARALDSARSRLEREGLADRVRWIHADHARLEHYLDEDCKRPLLAVMFNLGYLPGTVDGPATRPESTLVALQAALNRLDSEGILTVVLYPGHTGGAEEADQVLAWARTLDPRPVQGPRYRQRVLWYQFLQPEGSVPSLLAIAPGHSEGKSKG